MAYGWEGRLTRLVPLDRERHLENYVRWMNDPEMTAWTLVGDYPMTRLAEEEWFTRASQGSQTEVVWAMETLDGQHLGTSALHAIDWPNGAATTGTLIGDPSAWGKGYGTDAAKVRARVAFEVLGLRLLLSSVLEGNERSLRMQKAAGYVETGRIPGRYWKRGAYRDLITTCLTREAWERLQQTGASGIG